MSVCLRWRANATLASQVLLWGALRDPIVDIVDVCSSVWGRRVLAAHVLAVCQVHAIASSLNISIAVAEKNFQKALRLVSSAALMRTCAARREEPMCVLIACFDYRYATFASATNNLPRSAALLHAADSLDEVCAQTRCGYCVLCSYT